MDFSQFMSTYGTFIEFFVYVALSVMLFIKTKDTKYIKELYNDMKVKLVADSEQDKETLKESFTSIIPVYRLNKLTNVLEKTDEFVDLQELLNSYKDMALNNVLQKFMPVDTEIDTVVDASNTVKDDLDFLMESFAVAEEYRDKFGLDPSLSIKQVYDKMKQYGNTLDLRIKELKENEKKKNVEESK